MRACWQATHKEEFEEREDRNRCAWERAVYTNDVRSSRGASRHDTAPPSHILPHGAAAAASLTTCSLSGHTHTHTHTHRTTPQTAPCRALISKHAHRLRSPPEQRRRPKACPPPGPWRRRRHSHFEFLLVVLLSFCVAATSVYVVAPADTRVEPAVGSGCGGGRGKGDVDTARLLSFSLNSSAHTAYDRGINSPAALACLRVCVCASA